MRRPLPGERSVWHAMHAGVGAGLHVCRAIELAGAVDAGALATAVSRAAMQAPPCASRYDDSTGELVIAVGSYPPVFVLVEEADPVAAYDGNAHRLEFARAPFELAGGPYLRVLVQRAGLRTVLLAVAHHLAFDGPSLDKFVQHALRIYCGGEVSPLPGFLPETAEPGADAEHWRALGLTAADQERPYQGDADQVGQIAVYQCRLAADVAALRRAARSVRVSAAQALMTLFAATIHAVADDPDLVFVTPVDIRSRANRQALGMGVNALAVRSSLAVGDSFGVFAASLRDRFLHAYQRRQDALTDVAQAVRLVRRADGSSVLTDYEFNYATAWKPPACLASTGLAVRVLRHVVPEPQYDIRLSAIDAGERDVQLCWQVRGGAAAAETAKVMDDAFGNLARAWCGSGQRAVTTVPVVGEVTAGRLVRAGSGPVVPVDPRSVAERFLDQAAIRPGATAVRTARREITYADLRREVVSFRASLAAAGAGPRARVAVYLDRDIELVIAMLAAWASGAVYVPIDRSSPDARAAAMLRAVQPAVLLTSGRPGQAMADAVRAAGAAIIPMAVWQEGGLEGCRADRHAPPGPVAPYRYPAQREPAYVVFTSGSTGTPKAVEVHVGGLANHLDAKIRVGRLGPADTFGQLAPLGFDVHIWQLMAPLVTGGTLRIFGHEELRDPAELARLARGCGVTTLQAVPSYLELWSHVAATAGEPTAASGIPGLRTLYSTGEAFSAALTPRVRALFPAATLVNAYGPAEGSDNVTHHVIGTGVGDDTVVPIGRPIGNARVYVLDRWHRLRPPGLPGELALGGLAVSNGYLSPSPREAFLDDPWLAGGMMYLTGDVGSLQDGVFLCHGRTDNQVKLGGRRVELGEVENACLAVPGAVSAAACVAPIAGSAVLVAFVVGSGLRGPDVAAHVSRVLPRYMIPSRVLVVDRIPLTTNGKVDRAALAAAAVAAAEPSHGSPDGHGLGPGPRRDVDAACVRGVWEAVLGVSGLAVSANFFGFGGDSLTAMQAVVSLRAAGIRAEVTQLYEAQTLGEFTELILMKAKRPR